MVEMWRDPSGKVIDVVQCAACHEYSNAPGWWFGDHHRVCWGCWRMRFTEGELGGLELDAYATCLLLHISEPTRPY